MNYCVQIVAQLSKVNVCNKDNQQMEKMYNAIEDMMNILSYVDFAIMCNVNKYFPELNHKFGKEDINFPLSSSSRAIERLNQNLHEFESGVIKLIQEHTITSKSMKVILRNTIFLL